MSGNFGDKLLPESKESSCCCILALKRMANAYYFWYENRLMCLRVIKRLFLQIKVTSPLLPRKRNADGMRNTRSRWLDDEDI